MPSVVGYLPPALFGSKERTPVEKISYQSLFGVITNKGKATVAAVAANCGLSPSTVRQSLSTLADLGWVIYEDGHFTPCLTPKIVATASPKGCEAPKDVFSEKNRVPDQEGIVRVITAFIKSGINPAYSQKEAAKKAYGSPWNRKSAMTLVDKYGIGPVIDMIEAIGRRQSETYCPKPKGLTDLLAKWHNCERYLAGVDKTKGVIL